MELFDTTQLGLKRAISGAAQRQNVLADNVANANTPGFKPRDVDFHTALRSAFADGRDAVQSASFAESAQDTVVRADGSGVDIDVESAKLSQNALEYQTLLQVSKGRTDILKSAIGVS
ncbi:MAG: flagellar basal-body rod protein FlgB [bacterium]|jgi:flagellar basal-body rod protein FlgB|nr:flagellar basal-body rod protein FlgB [Solirubrobacteraceae bacterium]